MNIQTLFPVTISEIDSSLLYAQTIQNGLLPKERHFKKCFKDYFVFYKPQNKIGGDFYWLSQKENLIYFAMADCTGHGISGAMLSVLGISLLNYVIQKNYSQLGDYLNELDKKWIETFSNDASDLQFNNDWLELTLVSYNIDTKVLEYTSASGEFAIYQDNEIKLYKGNSFPIGGWQLETNRQFNTYQLPLLPDAKLYFFSDGFKHQFNFDNTKKFGKKQLLNLIEANSHLDLKQQSELYQFVFQEWKLQTHQTDDVSLIGFTF